MRCPTKGKDKCGRVTITRLFREPPGCHTVDSSHLRVDKTFCDHNKRREHLGAADMVTYVGAVVIKMIALIQIVRT